MVIQQKNSFSKPGFVQGDMFVRSYVMVNCHFSCFLYNLFPTPSSKKMEAGLSVWKVYVPDSVRIPFIMRINQNPPPMPPLPSGNKINKA